MSIHDESRGPVWGWGDAPDGDTWHHAGNTRAEAIAYAHALRGESGKAEPWYGYICEGRYLSPGGAAAMVVNLDEMLDRLSELEEVAAFDESPFKPRVSKPAAQAALEEAIRAWATQHLTSADHFTLIGEPEQVPPPRFDS